MGKEETKSYRPESGGFRDFHRTLLVLLKRDFAHITDFYGLNVKNYGPKNPSYHSGSQIGPFELVKLKTPQQYWFHTSMTW